MSYTDSGGNVYMFEYNEDSRVVRSENPDGTARTFSYDSAGDLTGVINPDGSTIQYMYDSDGNLVSLVLLYCHMLCSSIGVVLRHRHACIWQFT